ncbi:MULTISPECIES: hypothetical protein [Helicobacter]|nr:MULTISPECIES: hypothetical protein [Helicobacter]MDY5950328.1 hypothetical protein [Helicobacter sp.]
MNACIETIISIQRILFTFLHSNRCILGQSELYNPIDSNKPLCYQGKL